MTITRIDALRQLVDGMFAFAAVFSREGVLLEVNSHVLAAGGISPQEICGRHISQIDALSHSDADRAKVVRMMQRAAAGETVREELRVRLAGGRMAVVDTLFIPLFDPQGQIVQVGASGVEVTAHKDTEAVLRKLARQQFMLSSCNHVLLRAKSEEELLRQICNVIVIDGGYRLAWIGLAEQDAEHSVRPVAWAGVDRVYLDRLHIRWDDSPAGGGPTGRAIRNHTVETCRDIDADPAFEPWRERALGLGYASSVALPIMIGEHCAGALNIYSTRTMDFDAAELELLTRLVNDLAYGMGALRTAAEHQRQQALIGRMARVLRMQSAINAAVLRIRNRDELLQEACRLATQVGGYDRAVVSLVEPDGLSATPRFRAGTGADFPEPQTLPIGDGTEPDASLTSRALRTGRIVVNNDLTRSEPPVAMREELVRLGFKAVVALPLVVEGRKIGVVTLTSRDPTLMGDDELLLLEDMTASLSFALRSQEQATAFEFLASYDSLTGLAKRSLFCKRLDAALARATAPSMMPAVAAFDIHHLSGINDTYGRHFGDLLLQKVAERLRRSAASDEDIGYIGGGTFALIEPDLFAPERDINALLETTVFNEAFSIEGREIRISCRSGVARAPADGNDAATLVQNAEAALKRAKDIGEQYLHYKLEMHSEVAERLALEIRLRNAVDARQFELHYQPQVNIATGRIEAVEALLRWNDPERGLVGPAEFLPVLESSGLIVPLGDWILNRAVQDCRRWAGMQLSPVRVAVNVSPIQLRRRDFVRHVLECAGGLARELPGFGLDLEITETAFLQDIEGTSRKLQELRAASIRIALDDFGTGYSSLGLLTRLPVDVLKIDRSFVAGLPGDRASLTLASTISSLASAFGLISVGEGVETPEQLAVLAGMSCDLSQGYLHHAPLPVGELERLLSAQGSQSDAS